MRNVLPLKSVRDRQQTSWVQPSDFDGTLMAPVSAVQPRLPKCKAKIGVFAFRRVVFHGFTAFHLDVGMRVCRRPKGRVHQALAGLQFTLLQG